jgi:hypothetical protein
VWIGFVMTDGEMIFDIFFIVSLFESTVLTAQVPPVVSRVAREP